MTGLFPTKKNKWSLKETWNEIRIMTDHVKHIRLADLAAAISERDFDTVDTDFRNVIMADISPSAARIRYLKQNWHIIESEMVQYCPTAASTEAQYAIRAYMHLYMYTFHHHTHMTTEEADSISYALFILHSRRVFNIEMI
jgi:hypothetical protein